MKDGNIVLTAAAPAKINLSLKFVGKRSDNYHLLDSIFIPFSALSDSISITVRPDGGKITLSSNLPEMSDADTNLCVKAAKLYCALAGIEPSLDIFLEKRIPVGAGLGGGSSDCAAVLNLLNNHFGALREDELADAAVKLGADVPFFLKPFVARVGGIGEKITPLKRDVNLNILIFSPPFSVSTIWAYKHLDQTLVGSDPSKKTDILSSALENDDILTAAKMMHNDFEKQLFSKFPAYDVWRRTLLSYDALHVGISGSGSVFFAVFENDGKMQSAKKFFAESYGDLVRIYG